MLLLASPFALPDATLMDLCLLPGFSWDVFLLGEFVNNYTIKPLKKQSHTYIKLFDTKVNQWSEYKDQPLFTALANSLV